MSLIDLANEYIRIKRWKKGVRLLDAILWFLLDFDFEWDSNFYLKVYISLFISLSYYWVLNNRARWLDCERPFLINFFRQWNWEFVKFIEILRSLIKLLNYKYNNTLNKYLNALNPTIAVPTKIDAYRIVFFIFKLIIILVI